MNFNYGRTMEHDPLYNTPYFNYTSYSDHSITEGLWSRRSVFRGYVDMEDAIQRQVEKNRIREEILAEEAARRRRVLEAEVRRELMMETQNNNGGGFQSSCVEPVLQPVQPFAPVSFEERYGGSGRRRREMADIEAVSVRRPFWSARDGELKVIHLDGSTNRKPLLASGGGCSSELKHCSGGSEIGLGVASKKQFSLMKNSNKCVPIDSKKEDKKNKLSFRCTTCDIEVTSELVMNQHKEGKKHIKNLEKLKQESGGHENLGVRKRSKPKKTRRKQKLHKVARRQS